MGDAESHQNKRQQRQQRQPRWTAPASFLSLLAFQQYLSRACAWLFLLGLCAALGGCACTAAAAASTSSPGGLRIPLSAAACPPPRCARSTDKADMDYFPHKAIPTIGSFQVVYFPAYKVLTETRTGTQFVLYHCGTAQPTPSATAGFRANAKLFEVPLQRIAVDESVSAGYLELLGVRGAVKFFDVSYVSSPCLLRLAEEGRLPAFEAPYGNATKRAEQLAQVDAYFASNVADPHPKAIPQSSSADESLLNRAEWLKFYAYFFNKEYAAIELWTGIKNRYGQYKLAATEAASSAPHQARVGFVTYQAPASWSPDGSVSLSSASYKRTLVEDGGAVFPVESDASWPLGHTSDFLAAVAAAKLDLVLDESYYDDPTKVTYTQVLDSLGLNNSLSPTLFPFLPSAAVWREDARGSLKPTAYGVTFADDWFEDAQVESDALLLDFLRLVQPTLYAELVSSSATATRRLWFRNMGANESVQFETAAQCTDLDAPALPLLEAASTEPFHCPDYFHEEPFKLPVWAIVLIALGGVLLLALVALVVVGARRHRALQYKYTQLEMQVHGKEDRAMA